MNPNRNTDPGPAQSVSRYRHPGVVRSALYLTLISLLSLGGCADADTAQQTADTPTAEAEGEPGNASETFPYTHSSTDFPVPDFSLERVRGGLYSDDMLEGRLTIVNFWATWCGPCVIEIPELVVLYDEWKDRGLEIIGVAMDDEGFDLVRPFAEELAINYPVILDGGELAEAFGGVYALPTSFVIDSEGRVRDRYIGVLPLHEKRAELEALLPIGE